MQAHFLYDHDLLTVLRTRFFVYSYSPAFDADAGSH